LPDRYDEVPMRESEVIFHGSAWTSEKKGMPRRRDALEDAYDDRAEWQDYLVRYRPDDMKVGLYVQDVDKLERNDTPEGTEVEAIVPASLFLDGNDPEVTFDDVVRRIYLWMADEFGWPPPPRAPGQVSAATE